MADVFNGSLPVQPHCACGSCKAELIQEYDRKAHELLREHPELRHLSRREDADRLSDAVFGACALIWLRGSCPRVVPPQRKRGFPLAAVGGAP